MGNGDEIDQLGHQFNEMGEKLQAQVKILQNLAEENKTLAAESERGAVLDERQRLARELHDSVSQQLFALTMLSAAAQRYFTNQSPRLEETLNQMNNLANAAQREMRALLLHLRPVELDGRSLKEACEGFLTAVQERHGFDLSFDYTLSDTLPPVIEQQLFRVLQEAAANVLKHAQATAIKVTVGGDETSVHMTVLDNGIGIENEDHVGENSYGIQSMRERAAALGGTFDVWQRTQGTAVRVAIPRISQSAADSELGAEPQNVSDENVSLSTAKDVHQNGGEESP
jgi:NarL family two-component system sensor histidine kinase LiaS